MSNFRRSFRKFMLSFVITIIVIGAVAGGAYAALRMSVRPPEIPDYVEVTIPIPRPSAVVVPTQPAATANEEPTEEPTEEIPEYETIIFQRRPDFYTFLFYGLDDGNNVDAILVGAFDGGTGNTYLISLPRDTRVDANRTVRKLVGAYAAGRRNGGGHEGGIDQLLTEVSTIVGFRPDFYIGIRESAFVQVIDAIGGVEVNVPFTMDYNDPYQDLHIFLTAGRQRLTGQQALHFARFRQFDEESPHIRHVSPFLRQESQQQIISGAMREILSPRTITLVPELIRIYTNNVSTNLSAFEIAWFAEQLPELSAELLSAYNLPIARTIRQGWYEVPDVEATLELINRTVNPFIQEITAEMLRIVE